MKRDPLSARSALIVAPHPDDETIGAWALIRRLRRQGTRVEVMIVSDGGASHPGSTRWPVARLIAARRRETLMALRGLKIMPSMVRFLGLQDGSLEARPSPVRKALRRALTGRGRDLVVGPHADDAHGDHRAVATQLARLGQGAAIRLAYRVWPLGAARKTGSVRVPLTTAEQAMKRRALCGYRTQMGMITDATAGFAMTHRHLRAFAGPCEHFKRLR